VGTCFVEDTMCTRNGDCVSPKLFLLHSPGSQPAPLPHNPTVPSHTPLWFSAKTQNSRKKRNRLLHQKPKNASTFPFPCLSSLQSPCNRTTHSAFTLKQFSHGLWSHGDLRTNLNPAIYWQCPRRPLNLNFLFCNMG
jgi:hypothetical protein